ncbi:DEAD/DEAH box helicase [Plebeiibacterium sediminum]|uniref:DEAD/DEAH box helicase n=1 Tax=Plebeiibacterium sediminum TaxID=2992112 RepID=A0AAE3M8L1_9BACT|nr:DEAD/DEAH box helicase [Plebeiobacterium sediminum]MCW3788825.1 DEAD/DEAH box helicase [Plebeiobacterium sediminum]
MPEHTKKDYIERFIKFKATDAVIQKGKDLYDEGAVNLTYKSDASDAWHFAVQGSQRYTVIIKDLNKEDIHSKCTCPFEWGTICKHTVASLLYIVDAGDKAMPLDMQNEVTSNSSLRTAHGFLLEDYRFIDADLIKKYSSFSVLNDIKYSSRGIKIKDVIINNHQVIFELFDDYRKETSVTIVKHEDKVYISSDIKAGTPKLNKLETFCLITIAESKTPDLLHIAFNEGLTKIEQETLERYGFDNDDDFSIYFKHIFNPNYGLDVAYQPNQVGLIPIEPIREVEFLSFIEKQNAEVLELDNIPRATDDKALGFVIDFGGDIDELMYDEYDFIDEDPQFEIYAITAKPAKNKRQLASGFKKYDEFEAPIILTDNQRNALDLINELDDKDLSAKKQFVLKKKLILLLSKERFVFVREQGDFKLKKTDLVPAKVSDQFVEAKYHTYEDAKFVGLELKVKIGEAEFNPSELKTLYKKSHIYNMDGVIHLPANFSIAKYIEEGQENIKMVKSYKQKFIADVVIPLSKNFEIEFGDWSGEVESVELDFRSKQIYLSEQYDYLIITPQVEYHHGVSVALNHSGNVLIHQDEDQVREYVRNFELEDDFVDSIAALHPFFEEQKEDKVFYLHYDEFTRNMWFYQFFDKMQSLEVEVFGLKELKNFNYSPHQGKVTTSVSSGQDWFEVDIKVTFGDDTIALKDIKKAILNKQKYIQLANGKVGLLPSEWMHKLEKYFRHGEVKDGKLTVSKLRFSIIDELFDEIDDVEIINEVADKRRRLAQFTEISKTVVPDEIKAELRPYQKEGLNWLNFLDEMGWGGILADDMGLGKTLQVLTFLQHILSKDDTTNLIIVPTTLLFNWQKEIEKFAPNISAYYHYGPNRALSTDAFEAFDIVFTSYGVLLRDVEFLRNFRFNYVILDESQAIKNPASRRYKAVSLINAKNRIALSGTPIENSTFDLFAQMSFVNRGFFGGVSAFKENFSNMIDKEGDENIAAELQRLINPFILRRTKERVAKELPAKTEDVIYCEMDKAQRKVYDAYRNEFRNKLLGKIDEDGVGKSKMMVLEALTRLRQICDSPVLINDDNIDTSESVKIKEIIQHITDKTSKHKILIFSQFVKMLGLIKNELNKRNIEFEYLDGKSSTTQRERSVENFQNNDDLRVFLISLKAGGTGLNLTAADYVYIIDPWWNPAVENQAIDRCYRIGQDKKVFAYRMICKDTVEEKILNLQNKKKKIAGDIVQTDENIMKTLEADDIKDLFS